MKKVLKRVIAGIVHTVNPAKLIILNYHQASAEYDQRFHTPGTWTQIDKLEQDILYLKRKYNVVSLRDVFEGKIIPKNSIAITFDDGLKSIEEHVVPLFVKHEVPASFFINTAYLHTPRSSWGTIGNYLYYSEEYKKEMPPDYIEIRSELRKTTNPEIYNRERKKIERLYSLLPDDFSFYTSLSFLQTLNSNLFCIGLHGHEHQRFSMLNETEKEDCIKQNIEKLANLKCYLPFFAIPYGKPHDWDHATAEVCEYYSLRMMTACGGQNRQLNEGALNRIPADSQNIAEIIRDSYFKAFKDRIWDVILY